MVEVLDALAVVGVVGQAIVVDGEVFRELRVLLQLPSIYLVLFVVLLEEQLRIPRRLWCLRRAHGGAHTLEVDALRSLACACCLGAGGRLQSPNRQIRRLALNMPSERRHGGAAVDGSQLSGGPGGAYILVIASLALDRTEASRRCGADDLVV